MANTLLESFGKYIFSLFIASGLIGYIVAVVLPSDSLIQPALDMRAQRDSGESIETTKLTIANDGRGPANNLRVTINPQYNITSYKPIFYTEEVSFEQTGERSLIAKLPRLAPGTRIVLELELNSTESSPAFAIYANHDKGSIETSIQTNGNSSAQKQQIITTVEIVVYTLSAVTIGLAFLPFIYRWRRSKREIQKQDNTKQISDSSRSRKKE